MQAKGEKIKEEETKCQAMADAANADLAEAMPMLNAAVEALDTLNKKDISELKAYGRPPQLVEMVMQAVMILKVRSIDTMLQTNCKLTTLYDMYFTIIVGPVR